MAYTDTQILAPESGNWREAFLKVSPNGGALAVQMDFDGGWGQIAEYTESGLYFIECRGTLLQYRFVPSGGAEYEFGLVG